MIILYHTFLFDPSLMQQLSSYVAYYYYTLLRDQCSLQILCSALLPTNALFRTFLQDLLGQRCILLSFVPVSMVETSPERLFIILISLL